MEIKVKHFEGSVWRVVGEHEYDDFIGESDDTVLFEGSLVDCEAWLRLRKNNYL